jgi:dipeptidyl aminopeptidase/acylaminoacyl peptidase
MKQRRNLRYLFVLPLLVLLGVHTAAQDQPGGITGLIGFNQPDQRAVLLLEPGTGAMRSVTIDARDHHLWGFSPDGCRMLLTLGAAGQPGELVTARRDGGDVRSLVRYDALPPEDWGVWEPQWAPGGDRIVFTMYRRQREDPTRTYSTHIAWVAADGGEPAFYSQTGREYSPRWAPDGSRLAYVSYDQRVPGADLFATAVPTSEPAPGATPAPLPTVSEADIWVVNADGTGKYRQTAFPTGSVSNPRWSPDGELIAFTYSPSPANDMVWMVGAVEGAAPTQLTFAWSLLLDLAWSPDSSHILATLRDFQGTPQNQVYVVPLVADPATPLAIYPTDVPLAYPDLLRFSPGGDWLALRDTYAATLLHAESGAVWPLPGITPGNTPAVWSPAVAGTCE